MSRISITETGIPLARLLMKQGFFPDLRCGGKGRCGRCRLRVLSGLWEEAGRQIAAPAWIAACQSVLLRGPGSVEMPEEEETVQEEDPPSPFRFPYPDLSLPVVGIDLGTTNLVGALLLHGKILRCVRVSNAQRFFGDNVIDRITMAETEGKELQKAVNFSLSRILKALAPPENSLISLAGNTVMLALLCGSDPSPIGHAPFTVPEMDFSRLSAADWGWYGRGELLVLPPISAYLGGDVTAGWKETAPATGEMLVDLGTNCEILYHTANNGILGTSAAAGPAFEGSGISCGSRAGRGIITHIPAPGREQVCGGGQPEGISGTALVDLLYWARKLNRIDRFGKCREGKVLEVMPGFFLQQEEIARLLTAKAAICAGITALERFAGSPAKKIFLAGAFASSLHLGRATAIGMLPPQRDYQIAGNTSLAGALRAGCEKLTGRPLFPAEDAPREIPSGELPTFAELFTESMLLP